MDAYKETLHNNGLSDDIDIEFIEVPFDRTRSQYQRWLSSERSDPDIIDIDTGWAAPFIARDYLLNLSEEMPDLVDQIENEFFNPVVRALQDFETGDQFGVPRYFDIAGMMYRKDWAEEAGYSPAENNWQTEGLTWKEMSQVTKDIQEQQGAQHGFTTQGNVSQTLACCPFNEQMTSWGGAYFGGRENLYGPVGDRPITVTEEPVIQSLKMMRRFIYGADDDQAIQDSGFAENITPSDIAGWQYQGSLNPFLDGNAVMHRNWGSGFLSDAVDAHGTDKLGYMVLPYAENAGTQYDKTGIAGNSALGGWSYAVNKFSDNIENAKEVIRAAVSDEFYVTQFEQNGDVPPKPSVLDSNVVKETSFGPYVDTFIKSAENVIPRPASRVWLQEWESISQNVNAVYRQEKTPETAMQDCSSELESIEQEYA
ncbi:extracellular solute-binding protein [Haloarcula laminariae]|uniref:extracellular solute-binding protein n=1 Tax=Haloarcula laminariae TaxID=2961577 RepID=UPI0021C8956B